MGRPVITSQNDAQLNHVVTQMIEASASTLENSQNENSDSNTSVKAIRKAQTVFTDIAGTFKFLDQFDHGGSGDYTPEKNDTDEAETTNAEIRKMFGF